MSKSFTARSVLSRALQRSVTLFRRLTVTFADRPVYNESNRSCPNSLSFVTRKSSRH